jgi:hypothetical protein
MPQQLMPSGDIGGITSCLIREQQCTVVLCHCSKLPVWRCQGAALGSAHDGTAPRGPLKGAAAGCGWVGGVGGGAAVTAGAVVLQKQCSNCLL